MATIDPVGVQFEIHVQGDETLETFTGKFRAKPTLSWNDRLAMSRYQRELLGPLAESASADITTRCTIIAELSVRLTEMPDWWRSTRGGLDLVDDSVVTEVYQAVIRIRDDYVKAQIDKANKAKAALVAQSKKEQ